MPIVLVGVFSVVPQKASSVSVSGTRMTTMASTAGASTVTGGLSSTTAAAYNKDTNKV